MDINFDESDIELFKKNIIDDYNYIINKDILDIKVFNYDNSSLNSVINFLNINNIHFDKLNTKCIVFFITRENAIVNYTFKFIINKQEYITIGSNLVSKYGEFRKNLININKIHSIFDITKYRIILDYFLIILNKKIDLNFTIGWKIYNTENIDVDKECGFLYYVLSYIIHLYYYTNNDIDYHINKNFYEIMFDSDDYKIFNKYYIKNKSNIDDFINYLTEDTINYCQKIVPMSYLELYGVGNIIHPQWKELIINKRLSKLVYNFVSTGFPLLIDWFIITNSDKTLYDNDHIYETLLYSENIFNILNKKGNNITLKDSYKQLKRNRNILHKFLVDNDDSDCDNYSLISNILMSNYSICYIYEYVGETLYNYLEKNKVVHKDYNLFSKMLFEIIYNLYCINLQGIFHKDLHLNNITINNKFNTTNNDKDEYIIYNLNSNINNNPVKFLNNIKLNNSEFSLNDTDNIYKFKDNGLYTHLIDFNQSILYAHSYNNIKSVKNDGQYIDRYMDAENINIISTIRNIFPNFVKQNFNLLKDKLKDKDFYDNMFIKLSAYDMYKLSLYLLIYFKRYTVNKNILDLLNNINLHSYKILKTIKNINITPKDNKFPNYIFLNKYFSEFTMTNKKMKKNESVSNLFNIDNIKLEYSNIPSEQHPFYKQSNIVELDTKLNKLNINFYNNKNKNLESLHNLSLIGKLNYENLQENLYKIHNIVNDNDSYNDYSISNI